jgi:hypothetical protein
MSARTSCSLYFENTHEYHKVEEGIFELSDLRAGNVRDQIVRATYLTRSIVRDKFVDDKLPLLVLGGGAAGVSCAIEALKSNISVWLVEMDKQLFATQMATTSRVIDPMEFDWPLPHWSATAIPEEARQGFALAYKRGIASTVAAAWLIVSDQFEDNFPEAFEVVRDTDARKFKYSCTEKGIEVKNLRGRTGPAPPFGAVISCVGFGEEIVFDVEKRWRYRGVKFWATDTLHKARLGFSKKVTPTTINSLVSGGGDGAQQDLLRILTGCFGKELVTRLSDFPGDKPRFSEEFQRMSLACKSIDDLIWDSVKWDDHKAPSAADTQKWHVDYSALIDSACANLSDAELQWQCDHVIRAEIKDEKIAVTWLLRDGVPSVCYPLNRLLTTWVLRLYQRVSNRPLEAEAGHAPLDVDAIVVRGFEIAKVQAVGEAHDCGQRKKCYARPHLVYVVPANLPSATPKVLGEFHEIVIRHGINKRPPFEKSARSLMLRSTDLAP